MYTFDESSKRAGTHKHSGRRTSTYNAKDADGSSNYSDGKPSKRVVSAGYGSHEVGPRLMPNFC